MPKRSIDPGFLRPICFAAGFFCSVIVINGIRFRELSVPFDKNKFATVSQASDPDLFWGIVIFISLMAATLFFANFFAKAGRRPK
jgi:hypothetical protein